VDVEIKVELMVPKQYSWVQKFTLLAVQRFDDPEVPPTPPGGAKSKSKRSETKELCQNLLKITKTGL